MVAGRRLDEVVASAAALLSSSAAQTNGFARHGGDPAERACRNRGSLCVGYAAPPAAVGYLGGGGGISCEGAGCWLPCEQSMTCSERGLFARITDMAGGDAIPPAAAPPPTPPPPGSTGVHRSAVPMMSCEHASIIACDAMPTIGPFSCDGCVPKSRRPPPIPPFILNEA